MAIKNVIYQIGRFDRNLHDRVNFQIDDKIYPAYLSSFALKEYFKEKGEEAKVILLYPVSLIINDKAVSENPQLPEETKEKFLRVIKDISERENFFKKPEEYYKLHPYSEIADGFTVIHSIGEFSRIRFEADFNVIKLKIFLDMVERFLEEPFNRLYLDISSGYNIYVSALIEAGRLFLIFYKLHNFLTKENPENSLRVYLSFSDPIIPFNPSQRYEIHLNYELDVKAFFSWPHPVEQPKNLENPYPDLINKLANNDRQKRKYLRSTLLPFLINGYLFYSAIRYNTPLVLYTLEYDSENDVIGAIRQLINDLKPKLEENYQKTPELPVNYYERVFLMLSFYLGLIRVLKAYEIEKKEEVSYSELYSKFRDHSNNVYKPFDLHLNRDYLAHEMSNNFEKKEMREKFSEEYKLLTEIIGNEKDDKDINRRNFIAHCGFERNCVEVKKVDEEIWIRYRKDENILKRIKEILLELEYKGS